MTLADMLSIFLLLLANTTAGYLLPPPSGKFNVTLTTGPLIDYTRNDPFAPTPTPRALMLSIFQPATCESTIPVPYMPNKTASYQGPYLQKAFNITTNLSPLFLEARLPVCPPQPTTCSNQEDFPILLLSPGWGIPRLYYSVLASAITSQGFTVITIDHPHDANIITYPDGATVYLNASTYTHLPESEHVRAADASFIIDQLSNATAIAELLPERGARPFNTDRIGMLGHSLGGASSVFAAALDPRIRAAINWDGTIFGSLPSSGISQPVMLMMDAVTGFPQDWARAWPLFKGPKLWVEVANTTHQTFSDAPTLLEAAGQDLGAFAELLGTIEPGEMVGILAEYAASWMNGAFDGKEGGELPGGGVLGSSEGVSTVRRGGF